MSEDGGRSWQEKETGVRSALYCGIILSDDRTIWGVGDDGCVLVSHNRGDHWERKPESEQYIQELMSNWLNACDFSPNGTTGWIVGANGIMMNTVDNGETWSLFRLEGAPELVSILFCEEGAVWCVGNNGTILRSA